MTYKTIPFVASVSPDNGTATDVANQLQTLITKQSEEGWEFIGLSSVSTDVKPENGCFGIGGKPGYSTSFQVATFKK